MMEKVTTVLCVDDEESILKSLRRTLGSEGFDVITAADGRKAVETLLKEKVAVIITDQRMPGMTGTEVLEKVKELSPDTVRILLTGYADIKAVVDAINRGEVWRYITKPWENEELVATVRQAVEHYNLVNENRELFETVKRQNEELKELNENLEKKVQERTEEIRRKNQVLKSLYEELDKTFMDFISIFSNLLELRDTREASHSRLVAKMAVEIGTDMGLKGEVLNDLEVAGLLHDVGKVLLPESVMMKHPVDMSDEEMALYRRHPQYGAGILSGMKRLSRVATFIRHHHELYDGSGFPDSLKGIDIPLGARILSVANTISNHLDVSGRGEAHSIEKTVSYLEHRKGTFFDPSVVDSAVRVLTLKRDEMSKRDVVSLRVDEIRPGMKLACDLYTRGGILLAPEGKLLDEEMVNKIRSFNEIDPVTREVLVFAESQSGLA